ncbi:IS3 family transposase [Mucilaginibacter sabulilitoris]|uniref:IS3 family transposase n=1 Tax=Mucilaginibacter sabulilitoris TaxID=1173583 RepID=A0ABZ0TMH6_9SPHI|nr:IS3 family transposase [Mucilaginibacter sabulilitoris]WPU94365.1 IS3 family transposase [Mucilaginibacter sabulilitoris]
MIIKQDYPQLSWEVLCRLFGKTRHAHYDHLWRAQNDSLKEDIILQLVYETRDSLPRLGTRKMIHMLAPRLKSHGIVVGRDYLFDLLGVHKLLIRQRKKKAYTTDSRHWMHKYNNLVKDLPVARPEQVWVSDMTYIRVMNQWGYLSLITDAFSRKIMGYCFRDDMLAQGCLEALQMALNNRIYHDRLLIHHSDRGSQYCSKDYVNVLLFHGVQISMTQNGDPYENALAERMNGIIKEEFNLYSSSLNFEQTRQKIEKSIKTYNEVRPHGSCDYLTPSQAHTQQHALKRRWKSYQRKWQKENPVVKAV